MKRDLVVMFAGSVEIEMLRVMDYARHERVKLGAGQMLCIVASHHFGNTVNVRSPAELVNLVPGMRYVRRRGGFERGHEVQGAGVPLENTEFQIDGLNANAGMDERGITIPNVDTIAEFRVETSSFSAENGCQPVQMIMATKSGTNEFVRS